MKKLWKRFNNLNIRIKLMLIYIAIGILPVMGLFTFSYIQIRTMLYRQEESNIRGYMVQAASSLEGELAVYNNLSDYIAFDQGLAQITGADYKSVYEQYEQISTQLDPMLHSLMYFHKEVLQVTLYSENCAVPHDTSLAALEDVMDEPWYETAMESTAIVWYVDEAHKKVISVRRMPLLEQMGTKGLLYIEVDYNTMFEPFEQIPRTNCHLSVNDKNGMELYGKGNMIIDADSDNIYFEEPVGMAGWTVRFYQPEKVFDTTLGPITNMAILTTCLCIIGALIGFVVITMSVTRRIRRLMDQMLEVESGNLQFEAEDDSKDEIGVLTRGFHKMLKRLQILITEVYGSKIAQKEYEMKALQSQINPHFLYNTLSMINWKAIEAGEKDISKITLALSTFYRTALNKGKNILKLRDEISNIRSYLEIQQMMHDDSFDVEIDMSDDIMECDSLNLILQPLVENAIEHGIDMLSDRRGKITLCGRMENDCVVLRVEDNGPGMDEEMARKIVTRESKGYGVRNVNERIRLYYGDEYEVKILSEVGNGTVCVVRFPAKIVKNDKNSLFGERDFEKINYQK